MKIISSPISVILAVLVFGGTALAGSQEPQATGRSVREITVRREQPKEITVFVTGSLIPRRVRVEPVGTTTVSPVRVIDRREIDSTGRFTTVGAFVNEPSVRILDFGH